MFSVLIQVQEKVITSGILDYAALLSIAKMSQKNHNIIQSELKACKGTLILLLCFQTFWLFFTAQLP